MKQVLSGFARNTVFANILLIIVLIAGSGAAMLMVREEIPNVLFDRIEISVSFPGADPEEVEEGISRKIEEAIKGMEGIKTFSIVSREGLSHTGIEIEEGTDSRALLDRVRTSVEGISTFPIDAEKPVITLPLHAEPVMALYLNGDKSDEALREWGYRVKDQLLGLDEVSQVSVFGIRDYEINVEVSEQNLRKYGLTFTKIVEAVRRSNLNRSGGVIRDEVEEIRVRTVGRKYTGEDIASVVVLAGREGDLVTLDRVADIRDGFSDETVNATVNGKPAIILAVFKTSEEDTIRIAESVSRFLEDTIQTVPPGFDMGILYDNSVSIRQQVNVLLKNGIMGLLIVFVILWLFLNTRLSLWTGVGILFSVFGGLAMIWVLGSTINMVSIFGFIMVLGIVADDAIVVGESIAWHRSQGKSAVNAAIDGVMEVGLPVMAAVTTTILAFLPLFFVEGMLGKFIRILPIVVIACLLISLVESFAVLPAHLSHLPGPSSSSKRGFFLFRWVNSIPELMEKLLKKFTDKIYSPVLRQSLRFRYPFLCLIIGVLMVSLGLIRGNVLKFDMIPERDGFFLTSIVEFPEGTPLKVTEAATARLEKAMIDIADRIETRSGDPLVKNILTLSGQAPEPEPGEFGPNGAHFGGVQVLLLDSVNRGIHSKELLSLWKNEVGPLYGAKSLSFHGAEMGPPEKPIEIGIDGNNLQEIQTATDLLVEKLKSFAGVFDVQTDLAVGKNEIQFTLKPSARNLGVTVQDLADQVYSGYFGQEVLRLQRDRDEVKIRVRYTEQERQNPDSLNEFRIRTPQGNEIPLKSVASTRISPGVSQINRADGMRRVMVSADVNKTVVSASEIIEELESGHFQELENRFPGISVELKGDAEETETSFDTMFLGFILAVMAIYMLIATLFRSYLQPLVILITIPFGLIGSIWGHWIMGWDLTMIAMFGMVGLTGIVVNDAIVLIERINTNIREKIPFLEAVRLGGKRRFRAVFLTSITTVGGLAPLMFESDFYAAILIPIAITIVFGVIFSTILTLLFIPCLLVVINDLRCLVFRLKHGVFPKRNEVEPAVRRFRNRPSGELNLQTEKGVL